MASLRSDRAPPQPRRSLGQRLFAPYGSAVILIVVLLVVIGWIGVLGWPLMWLLGRL
jgi:hypothetical protein